MRRLVMKIAWSFFKAGTYKTFSFCLKMAWLKWEISKVGKKGSFLLTFDKLNGQETSKIVSIFKKRPNPTGLLTFKNIETGGFTSTYLHKIKTIN